MTAIANRVKETSITTGTGTLDLLGAVDGFKGFVAEAGDASEVYYTITDSLNNWEVGKGTITDAATDTLSRTTVLSSSNSDSLVNFPSGTKSVWIDAPAQFLSLSYGVFTALQGIAPVSGGYATLSARNGHRVLEFDDTVDEAVIFHGVMSPKYRGGDITVTIYWAAATATTGDVVWDVSWERISDDGFDIDADSFDTVQSVTDTTASVSGELSYATITFTQTQADELAAGEVFRLKLNRDADNGSDDLVGDAQVLRVMWAG